MYLIFIFIGEAKLSLKKKEEEHNIQFTIEKLQQEGMWQTFVIKHYSNLVFSPEIYFCKF